jgi:mono/diheme cytochrome c family protein
VGGFSLSDSFVMLSLRLVVIWLVIYGVSVWRPVAAVSAQHDTPTAPPAATATTVPPAATPTFDRLAAPPTAANPNQADTGAQLFWLHCQPCHGDQAQGLTDEWRAQYPPEDQNCWESGCHGDQPYFDGFRLPTQVPALVGAGTLGRFATAADLHAYLIRAMPFQAPGSLTPDEYWSVTAFLLRGHGLSETALPITDQLAQGIPLGAPLATPTAEPGPGSEDFPGSQPVAAAAMLATGALLIGGLAWLLRTQKSQHG